VKGDRELACLDARGAGSGERLIDELAKLGGDGGVVGDVGAGSLAGADQLLLLEALVDGSDRVDVDPAALGELAHTRQPLACPRLAGADEAAQLPEELGADGKVAAGVDREPLGDQEAGRPLGGHRPRRHRRIGLLCH
jgi:hypothetical protein